MSNTQSTALARIGSPKAALATVKDLMERMREIQDQAFICSPFASLDSLPEFFRVSERVVVIDPDSRRGEVYAGANFLKDGEVALARPGLFKLWQAAGGTIISSRRTDDRTIPHYCAWEVVGEIRQIDGNTLRMFGSRTLDYRDGSEQVSGLKQGDISQKRRAIQQLAETFAVERMIRGCINLQQKYFAAELAAKPFVCYALIPDASQSDDPAIRRLAAAVAFGVVDKLYGPGSTEPRSLTTANGDAVDTRTGEVIREAETVPQEDPADFGAPPPPLADAKAPPTVCPCLCDGGCQREVHAAAAEATMRNVGTVRCGRCYPWHPGYDAKRHLFMEDLGLPLAKGMSGKKASEEHAAMLKRKAEGGRS